MLKPPKPPKPSAALQHTFFQALREFESQCSPDPFARTLSITTCLTTFWQLSLAQQLGSFPSTLFVGSPGKETSPLWEFARKLLVEDADSTQDLSRPRIPYVSQKIAEHYLRESVTYYHNNLAYDTRFYRQAAYENKEEYRKAHWSLFGFGRSRPFSKCWHKDVGLISNGDGAVVARLDGKADLRELQDYLKKGDFFQKSIGIDSSLKRSPKRFAVAGRLDSATLIALEENGLFEWGHPFLTLPDVGDASINVPLWPTFSAMLMMWRPFQGAIAVTPQNQFPRTEAALRYQSYLRDGLSRLPGDYGFGLLKVSRELFAVCSNLYQSTVAWDNDPPRLEKEPPENAEIILTFLEETLKGLIIATHTLIWHRVGLTPSSREKLIQKILHELRKGEDLTRRELQRTFRLSTATERDTLLTRLAEEGMITLDGKMVSAVSLDEYTRAIHSLL
ncbi:hypothetical protein [Roseibacillus ishigakijimensis]|uniref:Uncharacterized protein n=1 Tax=Roseibacillus ishigakijimensis TaxID=454146 RepID=A0A934VN50_9BACT|nr:hypothetical protein [Roseibacillus ishigakijimensis]MBK1834751.1 hypothetical protein [Roseibacillus ishigakijimensis]